MSLYVRGLRGEKRYTIFRWAIEKKYDICMLQETYCTPEFTNQFKRGWKGSVYHSCSNSHHSRGVCILLREGLQAEVINTYSDKQGRFLLLNIKIQGRELCIVNVYAPNTCSNRSAFFKDIKKLIDAHACSKANLIIGGDFNTVLHETDRAIPRADTSSVTLRHLMAQFSLEDIWRKLNPQKIEYSYIDPQIRASHSRIDFWLISQNLVDDCINSYISPCPAPDHKSVTVELRVTCKIRGKGYWKLNNKHLEDPLFVEGVKQLISKAIKDYKECVTKSMLWEYIKRSVKEFAIKFSVMIARDKNLKENELLERINKIDSRMNRSYNENDRDDRQIAQHELTQIYKEKAKGYQVRSRAKWVEEGEKSSKYFANLERARQESNCIDSLKDKTGQVVTDDKSILSVSKDFYASLYSSQRCSDDELTSWFNEIVPENVLNETEKESCEGKITFNECRNALSKMKNNKSPGLDGISIEFYKKFWDSIGNVLVDMYNECYERGELVDSQNLSVFSLIYKKGDKADISNYRPISLSNVDYKILAFVLAHRVQNVVGNIINKDQSAYIKGRYMGHNIRLVNDVIDHYDQIGEEGMLFLADFKKAFDSLEWNFMIQTLSFFNFGDSFMNWVKTLYGAPKACIKNNGYISDTFTLHRGIRQGCPVSALLFIIAVEVLGLRIRQCKDIDGFVSDASASIKLTQYADDCLLFLRNKHELCTSLSILNNFGSVSGLTLNIGKCEGLWIGSAKNRQDNCTLFGINWPETIKYLGIYIGHNKETLNKKNWSEKIPEIESCLDSWSRRDLSLFGKIAVIKTFAVSKLVLQASVLVTPVEFTKRINKLFFHFLWGKKDKVNRKKVIKQLSDGGLGMVDIDSLFTSFKANWLNKIIASDHEKDRWVQLPTKYLRKIMSFDNIRQINIDDNTVFKELKECLPFWQDVIKSFSKLNSVKNTHLRENILSQQIWGNKCFIVRKTRRNEVLFFRNWIRSGIVYVRDLLFKEGVVDCARVFNIVQDKRNLYIELNLIRQALLPYKQFIMNNNNQEAFNAESPAHLSLKSSKLIYKSLVKSKTSEITNMSALIELHKDPDLSCKSIFKRKLIDIKENKLREFNYKLINNILPCNANLKKWKISESDACDVCDNVQTVQHLLFECTYVKPLWEVAEMILNTNISFSDVLCGDHCENYLFGNYICTIFAFVIYKDYLLHSLENKKRPTSCTLKYFENEICFRLEIYDRIGLKYK